VLVGDLQRNRTGRRVDDPDLRAQTGALERQAIPRQSQVAELRGQLLIGEGFALSAEPRLVQGDVRHLVGRTGIGLGRDQQEHLRASRPAPRRRCRRVLIAGERQRADDPRGQRVFLEVPVA